MMSRNLGALNLLEPGGPVQACNGTEKKITSNYNSTDVTSCAVLGKFVASTMVSSN
jgi:hypothetical protein